MHLWHGGTSVWEPSGTCVLVCRDRESENQSEEDVSSDVVALVADPDVALLLLTAPALLACSEVLYAVVAEENLDEGLRRKAQEALAHLAVARNLNTA